MESALSGIIGMDQQGRQDVIPGSAGIRTHLARGAARADFLLEGDPRNFGGIAGQESGFAYWATGEKPKIYLGKAEIPLENCRLRARPSSARMHLAHPSQRADPGITSCLPHAHIMNRH